MSTLLLYSTGIFLFLSLLLYPCGYLLSFGLPEDKRCACSFGIGAVLISALLLSIRYLGFSSSVSFYVLYLLFGSSIWFCARRGGFRRLLSRDVLPGILFIFAYYLLVVSVAAFPDGALESVSGEGVRLLTGMPLDNIIPFNFARYLVEDIPFDAFEVVPTWAATSRGPLAGSIVASVFLMLGASEKSAWLSTSPVVFFLFQCVMVYLNMLAFLAVCFLARSLFSSRVACWSMLALATSSFVFTNILFTWPKFFMTYYVLVVVLLVLGEGVLGEGKTKTQGIYIGLMAAGAYLSHQLSVFYLFPILLFVFARSLWMLQRAVRSALPHPDVRLWHLRENLREIVYITGTLGVALLPWLLLKRTLPANSPRMQYLHLFCIWDDDVSGLSFMDALRRYLSENSFLDIAQAKLENFWYPFDVFHPGAHISDLFFEPYRFVSALASVSFFQFIFAIGPILFVLAVLSYSTTTLRNTSVRPLLLLCLIALSIASLVFACGGNTLNHHWAYPAIALTFIAAASLTDAYSVLPLFVFLLGCAFNALVLILNLAYPDAGVLWLHASEDYFLMPSFALILCALCFCYMLFQSGRSDETL